jgi:AcrR family transcriptional regulator
MATPGTDQSTRARLLRTARDEFAAQGFGGARLADIAAAAGLTTGAFYRHFATKAEIVDVLFEDFTDELSIALVDAADLRDFCLRWLDVNGRHLGTVRAAAEVMLQDDTYPAHHRRLRKLWACAALPHLRTDLDDNPRRLLSHVLIDTLDYYFMTRSRGWASGTEFAGATNMARLFTFGLYGEEETADGEFLRSGSTRDRLKANRKVTRHAAGAAIKPLFDWTPARNRTDPTSSRGEAQRNAVLRAGAQVFIAAGYENSTIPQIAAQAGVSPGTVYRYFEDKRDLFLCLLSRAERSLYEETLWPLGPDGKLQIRDGVYAYFSTRKNARAVFRVWRELLDTDQDLASLWIATRHDFEVALARVIRRSQQDGTISSEYDSTIVSELLVALCDGPAHTWFDLAQEDNGGASLDDLADVVSSLISGDWNVFRK